jgi:hypothetical protein
MGWCNSFLAKLGECSVNVLLSQTATCLGSDNGTATAIASGETAPYTYIWNTTPLQSTQTATNLSDGSYTVTAVAVNGCYVSDTVTVNTIPVPNANAWNDTIICEGIKDTLHASGGISYLWSNNDTTQNIIVGIATTTTFIVTVTGTNGCTASDSVVVTIDKPMPTITCDSNFILCNQSYLFYQWYLNGILINGATSQTYVPIQNGIYTVEITDSIGCSATSSPCSITNGIEQYSGSNSINIFPNPANDIITIENSFFSNDQTIYVYNIQGQLLIQQPLRQIKSDIDISGFANGMYFIRVSSGDGNAVKKFVK